MKEYKELKLKKKIYSIMNCYEKGKPVSDDRKSDTGFCVSPCVRKELPVEGSVDTEICIRNCRCIRLKYENQSIYWQIIRN